MTEAAPKLPVLVVDDSPFSRKLLEHALAGVAYSLLFAENGKEALQLFKEHRTAIVITDWMLPDSSGPELCERIRAESTGSYTYIILLTSMTEKEDIIKGLSSGADDYLTKPFDRGELLARIGVGRRIIGLHREIDAKNKQLKEMAHTDPLTGLPNRRAIEEWGERQLRGAARHGYPLWVVHADLDSFKNINDSYGHDAGDQVLKELAAILKEYTRASDISGRRGGECLQHLIASTVAIAIVDILEGVQVRVDHPQGIAMPRRATQLPLAPLFDRTAVWQARERVCVRHFLELFVLGVDFAVQADDAAPHSDARQQFTAIKGLCQVVVRS